MTTRTKKWIVGLCAFTLLSGGGAYRAFAEDTTAQENAPTGDRYEKRQAKIEELKKLKQENPAEFERVMKERKEKMRAKLADLKEKDPQKYQEVKERMAHRRKEELTRLKREDPKKFQEIMARKEKKLEDLKKTDPARYAEVLKNHPHLAERLEHREGGHEKWHRGEYRGVRDHGQGIGRGKGQGATQTDGEPGGSNNG